MHQTLTVDQIMTRSPITVGFDVSLRTVRSLFDTYSFHHLIVVASGEVAGVLSDRDLLRNVSPFVGSLSETPRDTRVLDKRVHQIMTRRPVMVREQTTLADAGRIMLDLRVSCLPVVDRSKRPAGILTSRDLLSWTLDTLRHRAAPATRRRAA